MKYLIFIYFVFFASNLILYSQNSNNYLDSIVYSTKKNCNVSRYYKFIYKAEDLMMKGNFEKAAVKFEKAFTFIENPFMSDLGHARICEFKSRKDEECLKKYVYYSIRKTGLKNGYLNSKDYQELPNWSEIKEMIDTILPCFDTVLVKDLQRITSFDQAYRLQCKEMYSENLYNEFTLDSIETIDSINFYHLCNILQNMDFVSEEVYGHKGWNAINLILMHNREKEEIYKTLYKSVSIGKLDSRLFISSLEDANYLIGNKYPIGNTSHGFKISDDCYVYIRPTISEKIHSFKFRKRLNLENSCRFHKKRIWQMKNKDCGFIFDISVTYVLREEDMYNLIQNKELNGKKIRRIKFYYTSPQIKYKMRSEAKAWEKENPKKQ